MTWIRFTIPEQKETDEGQTLTLPILGIRSTAAQHQEYVVNVPDGFLYLNDGQLAGQAHITRFANGKITIAGQMSFANEEPGWGELLVSDLEIVDL